jgi:hypothetical protein
MSTYRENADGTLTLITEGSKTLAQSANIIEESLTKEGKEVNPCINKLLSGETSVSEDISENEPSET